MDSVLGRYKNISILGIAIIAQLFLLAVQVKRTHGEESTRLIRVWAVTSITPFERVVVWTQSGVFNLWHNYFYLRGVRQENRDLKAEIQRLRLQEVGLQQDADQAHRLQSLLEFKSQFISETKAAQVIGSSGSEQSRSVFIDKGARDGLAPDMAVITSDGVVGKVLKVYHSTAQVLLINDSSSGVGAILAQTRLQGVLRGSSSGEVMLDKIMNDEPVQVGEKLLTSGGDQIFPKGLTIGAIDKATRGAEAFLEIRVKPAADLSRLEEVLVITKKEEKEGAVAEGEPARAVDILAARLPSVPSKPVDASKLSSAQSPGTAPAAQTAKPLVAAPRTAKPDVGPGSTAPTAEPKSAPKLKPQAPAEPSFTTAPPSDGANEARPQ